MSEKPIAKDLATAQELLKWYHDNIDTSKVIWGVAENYRFFKKFLQTAEQVRKLGAVKTFRVNSHNMVQADFKYLSRLYIITVFKEMKKRGRKQK